MNWKKRVCKFKICQLISLPGQNSSLCCCCCCFFLIWDSCVINWVRPFLSAAWRWIWAWHYGWDKSHADESFVETSWKLPHCLMKEFNNINTAYSFISNDNRVQKLHVGWTASKWLNRPSNRDFIDSTFIKVMFYACQNENYMWVCFSFNTLITVSLSLIFLYTPFRDSLCSLFHILYSATLLLSWFLYLSLSTNLFFLHPSPSIICWHLPWHKSIGYTK